jgi:hypothetical protein
LQSGFDFSQFFVEAQWGGAFRVGGKEENGFG